MEPRLCPNCRYILDNVPTGRCPECGRAFLPHTSIATYRARFGRWRMTFYLGEKQMIVRSREILGTEAEHAFDLSRLDPDPLYRRVRLRALIQIGATLFCVGAAFGLVTWVNTQSQARPTFAVTPQILIAAMVAAIGMVILGISFRRVEFLQFRADDKSALRLEIARHGPDADHLDDFIELLRQQIRMTKPEDLSASDQTS